MQSHASFIQPVGKMSVNNMEEGGGGARAEINLSATGFTSDDTKRLPPLRFYSLHIVTKPRTFSTKLTKFFWNCSLLGRCRFNATPFSEVKAVAK